MNNLQDRNEATTYFGPQIPENFTRDILDFQVAVKRWIDSGRPLFPFWRDQPVEWFMDAERIFDVLGVRSDGQRIKLVTEALDTEDVPIVYDLIDCTGDSLRQSRYDKIKNCLIAKYCNWSLQQPTNPKAPEPQPQKVTATGDRGPHMMPSTLLRQILDALPSEAVLDDPDGVRSMWLSKLMPVVQVACAENDERLDKVASFADRVMTAHLQEQQKAHLELQKRLESVENNIVMLNYQVTAILHQLTEQNDAIQKMAAVEESTTLAAEKPFVVVEESAVDESTTFAEKVAMAKKETAVGKSMTFAEKATVAQEEYAVEESTTFAEKATVAQEESAVAESTTFSERVVMAKKETTMGKPMTFAEKAAKAKKETAEGKSMAFEEKATMAKIETTVEKTNIKSPATSSIVSKDSLNLCYYHEEFGARARKCRGGLCPYGKEAK